MLNILHLNNTHFKKVQIVKSIICPITDFFNVSTEDSIQKLECLKENLEKSLAMIVHGSPKLKKKIEEVTKRIEELMALQVEGVDTH